MTTYGTIPTSTKGGGKIKRAKERITKGLRPWKEFFDYHKMGMPASLSESIKNNLTYFAMNYCVASLIILFVSLLWHPISLIVFLIMLSAWLFFYFLRGGGGGEDEDDPHPPLVVMNRTVDDRVVIAVLSLLTLSLLFLTRATWNIISSVLLAALLVSFHALFRDAPPPLPDHDAFYTAIPSSSSPP